MDTLGSGIVILLNGLLDLLGRAASPLVAALVASFAALAWFARLEVDAMDREAGSKPEVGIH